MPFSGSAFLRSKRFFGLSHETIETDCKFLIFEVFFGHQESWFKIIHTSLVGLIHSWGLSGVKFNRVFYTSKTWLNLIKLRIILEKNKCCARNWARHPVLTKTLTQGPVSCLVSTDLSPWPTDHQMKNPVRQGRQVFGQVLYFTSFINPVLSYLVRKKGYKNRFFSKNA
mgnify:CR=1 FL=1